MMQYQIYSAIVLANLKKAVTISMTEQSTTTDYQQEIAAFTAKSTETTDSFDTGKRREWSSTKQPNLHSKIFT